MTLLKLPVSSLQLVIGPVVGVALVKGGETQRAKTLVHGLRGRRFSPAVSSLPVPGIHFSDNLRYIP